jgi:hypothetical protein
VYTAAHSLSYLRLNRSYGAWPEFNLFRLILPSRDVQMIVNLKCRHTVTGMA